MKFWATNATLKSNKTCKRERTNSKPSIPAPGQPPTLEVAPLAPLRDQGLPLLTYFQHKVNMEVVTKMYDIPGPFLPVLGFGACSEPPLGNLQENWGTTSNPSTPPSAYLALTALPRSPLRKQEIASNCERSVGVYSSVSESLAGCLHDIHRLAPRFCKAKVGRP